jgi:hypothetical protein
VVGLVILAIWGGGAAGQSMPGLSRGGLFASPGDLGRRHTAPTGKPCIALEGYSKAQVINKDINEHWIGATNSCGQHIKVQVCYHNSRDCIIVDVPAYGRKDVVLGIYPALKEFRYDAVEQF